MEELISVIVPVYNVEKYLTSCLESILCQSYKAFEVILVNDGSEDNSLDICRGYEQKDSRFIVIDKTNGGLSSARNAALDICKGKYIVFIDSDDYVSEYLLENLYTAVKSEDYDIVQCDMEIVNDFEQDRLHTIYSEKDLKAVSLEQALNERVYKVSAWGKIYKRSIWQELRFKEGIIYEDEDIYYKCLYNASKLAVLREKMYFYRMSEDSIMRNDKPVKSLGFINIFEDRIKFFKEKNEQIYVEGSYVRFCLSVMLFLSKAKVYEHNTEDWNDLWNLYKELFNKVMKLRNVSMADRTIFMLYRVFPNIIGKIIVKVKS